MRGALYQLRVEHLLKPLQQPARRRLGNAGPSGRCLERAIVAAPGHRVVEHPDALIDDDAVRTTTFVPEAVELIHRDGERFVLRQSAAFLTDNLFAALAALREGVGYGILPLWAVQGDLRRGALVRLCPDWRPPIVVLSLAYPPTRFRPRRLVALLAFIKSELTRAGGLGIAFLVATDAQQSIRTAPGLVVENLIQSRDTTTPMPAAK